jgi:CysZ protein
MDVLRGTVLIWRNPRLWGLCLAPLFAAIVVYIGLGALGWWLIQPHLHGWVTNLHLMQGVEDWIGIGGVLLWIVLFPFLFTLFAGAFAGVIFEPLSVAVEKVVVGELRPGTPLSFGAAMRDTFARLMLAVVLGLIAFALGFFLGPIPGIIVAALIGLLDYTSPVYARRGKTLGAQWADLFRNLNLDSISFAVVAGLLSLIPFVGVFLLPGMVAGGTLLVLRRESHNATR